MTTPSLVYNDPVTIDSDTQAPKALTIKVHFIGELPTELSRTVQVMPLEISITLPPEYARFTHPAIEVEEQGRRNRDEVLWESERTPSFLPLPASFDFTSVDCWTDVAQSIQDWAVDNMHIKATQPELWDVTMNLFWLSFVAAYPEFPRQPWPRWDSRIPLSGRFIENWITGAFAHSERSSVRLYRIWSMFLTILTEQFPHSPIIAAHKM